jgi:hypothetical protein
MEYRNGESLESLRAVDDISPAFVAAITKVWRHPPGGIHLSVRERPILGPISKPQYTQMPDAVLVTASRFQSVASELASQLAARRSELSVIHGDLKLDNAIRSTDGEVNLIDWECCGLGHPEDDLASLLASACVYAIAKATRAALRSASVDVDSDTLADRIREELRLVQRLSTRILEEVRTTVGHVSVDHLGAAFLVSLLCRLQGLQFVSSPQSVRLAVTEFTARALSFGPDVARAWLKEEKDLS